MTTSPFKYAFRCLCLQEQYIGFPNSKLQVFSLQPTRDCVVRTLKRLENKIQGPVSTYLLDLLVLISMALVLESLNVILFFQVLNQLLYLMKTTEKNIQMRIALALAHLCDPKDGKLIFIDNSGKYSHLKIHQFFFSCRFFSVPDQSTITYAMLYRN